jgi:hypothetical protein
MGTTARVGVYARSEEEANHVITSTLEELKWVKMARTAPIRAASTSIRKIRSFQAKTFPFGTLA